MDYGMRLYDEDHKFVGTFNLVTRQFTLGDNDKLRIYLKDGSDDEDRLKIPSNGQISDSSKASPPKVRKRYVVGLRCASMRLTYSRANSDGALKRVSEEEAEFRSKEKETNIDKSNTDEEDQHRTSLQFTPSSKERVSQSAYLETLESYSWHERQLLYSENSAQRFMDSLHNLLYKAGDLPKDYRAAKEHPNVLQTLYDSLVEKQSSRLAVFTTSYTKDHVTMRESLNDVDSIPFHLMKRHLVPLERPPGMLTVPQILLRQGGRMTLKAGASMVPPSSAPVTAPPSPIVPPFPLVPPSSAPVTVPIVPPSSTAIPVDPIIAISTFLSSPLNVEAVRRALKRQNDVLSWLVRTDVENKSFGFTEWSRAVTALYNMLMSHPEFFVRVENFAKDLGLDGVDLDYLQFAGSVWIEVAIGQSHHLPGIGIFRARWVVRVFRAKFNKVVSALEQYMRRNPTKKMPADILHCINVCRSEILASLLPLVASVITSATVAWTSPSVTAMAPTRVEYDEEVLTCVYAYENPRCPHCCRYLMADGSHGGYAKYGVFWRTFATCSNVQRGVWTRDLSRRAFIACPSELLACLYSTQIQGCFAGIAEVAHYPCKLREAKQSPANTTAFPPESIQRDASENSEPAMAMAFAQRSTTYLVPNGGAESADEPQVGQVLAPLFTSVPLVPKAEVSPAPAFQAASERQTKGGLRRHPSMSTGATPASPVRSLFTFQPLES
ncbi:hypothetical protein BDZ89DRAFT_1059068 [Hymenopellis radicata]|nr:hypothetical protein BDZ89DRAFT_1059068 [Hymenopellis radicata]